MHRREFMVGSLMASLAARLIAAEPGGPAGSPRAVRLERFIMDQRFADARDIAAHLARRGVPVFGVGADLTALWYEQLDLAWRERAESLAGTTTRQGLFVLETLAADRGMRVILRVEHGLPEAGQVRHSWDGPAALATGSARRDWRAAWAEALLSIRLGRASEPATMLSEGSGDLARSSTLCSWLMVPRRLVTTDA